jgi:hypothetical protein
VCGISILLVLQQRLQQHIILGCLISICRWLR